MSPDQMNPQEFLELTYARARQSVLSRRAVLGGFAALAAAMVLPDRAAFAEGRGGTLRIGRDQEPDSLDPQKTLVAVSDQTNNWIYEPLARLDTDGNVVPGLAERWDVTDNNKTIVFHLRDGVTFHDGSPVDAEACVWTTQRIMDPATASPSAYLLGPFDKAEVIDRLTVAYHFKEPFVPLWIGLSSPAAAILPRKSIEALGDQFGRNPVGCGPFRFSGWAPDTGIKLVRFDDYKCGPVGAPDEVQFLYFPEDSTRIAALETGEIDVLATGQAVPVDAVRRLRQNGEIQLLSRARQGLRALVFNMSKAPFDDIRVRQAVSHAIDREKVLAFALDGNGQIAHGPLPTTIPGYSKAVETLDYAYDPAKAKALLAEAGQQAGLKLRMITSDMPPVRRTAEIVQTELRDIGIELEIQSLPVAEWASLSSKGEHHIFFMAYEYNDADILYAALHSQGSYNRSFHKDPALDKLLEAQRVAFDPAGRQTLLDDAQALIMRQAYWAPLFEPLNFAALSSAVKDAALRSDGDISVSSAWIES